MVETPPSSRPWTSPADVAARWRPLSPDEAARAPGVIAMVERAVLRRWPDVQARLDSLSLDVESLRDVVASLARQILEVDPDVPLRAKSWQETSGSESLSVTLDGPLSGAMLTFDDWMIETLNSPTDEAAFEDTRTPLFHAPKPSKRLDRALRHDEEWFDDLRDFEEHY